MPGALLELVAKGSQDIFLTDQTIAENIALGRPREEINFDEVISAAKKANIHEYIINRPVKLIDHFKFYKDTTSILFRCIFFCSTYYFAK